MAKASDFPRKIVVRIVHPAPEGLAVKLTFEMLAKNNYSYIVFLNVEGMAHVLAIQLFTAFQEQLNAALMDYVDAKSGFNGQISIKLLTPEELEAALNAFEIYRKHLPFPDDYESKLRIALARGKQPSNCILDFQIEA